ncbi:MAG: transcription antitermination factor NusB [Bacilli bacterium]
MTNESITRNQAQEKTLLALYAVLTYLDMKEEVDVESIVSGIYEAPYAECPYFTKAVVIAVLKNLNSEIEAYNALMKKWTFDRLNRVEQALLLLSYSQYFYVEKEVEKAAVINVAVVLAKKYLEAADYKFVNAILDKVLTREH